MPILKFLNTTLIQFLFCAIALSTFSCASKQKIEPTSAAELIRDGIQNLRNKDYSTAQKYFQQVLEDYPDSKERVLALLYNADTLYMTKDFEEAKFSFQKFIELYPVHEKVDHAYFFKAMSDFRMIDLAARDQTSTRAALEEFEEFLSKFPKSRYHPRAKEKLKACHKSLAANTLFIGKYYFRNRSYQSAINRLTTLIEKYPGQKFNDEAVFLIAESYFKEQNFKKAKLTYQELLKSYPNSIFAKQARTRLKKIWKP